MGATVAERMYLDATFMLEASTKAMMHLTPAPLIRTTTAACT